MPTKTPVAKPDSGHSAGRSGSAVPARERLLAAADELFYTEGLNSVGIDKVIERAGVAKATLYSAFGSKDDLIEAYLHRRQTAREQRIARHLAKHTDPRLRLLSVFDALAEATAEPTFLGCAFVKANAEVRPDSKAAAAADEYRTWIRAQFEDLVRATGIRRPQELARRLHLLYDGAMVAAHMDHDTHAAARARSIAESLVDAALAA